MSFPAVLLQGGIVIPLALVLILFFIIAGLVLARVFGEAVRRNPNRRGEENREEEGSEEEGSEEEDSE